MRPRITAFCGWVKRVVPLIATVILLSSSSVATGPASGATRRPNLVLIMADDLGIEALGCYGGTSYPTPVLDDLARKGTRFAHAYAQPLCAPTRLQLMTGRYNNRNWVAFGILDPRERTFGHLLQSAGYTTCIAGKWQLTSYDPPDYPGAGRRRNIGMPPENAGFDSYCVWHAGHTEDKGSRYADPVIVQDGMKRDDLKGQYGPDLFADYILEFIERNRDRPFFVYYPMVLTHAPFVPTPDSPEWHDPSRRLEEHDRHFGEMVVHMDQVIGRIVARLDDLGLRENTLLLFFSDNGTHQAIESRMEDRTVRGGKGLTTDAGTHVPLIANWPSTTPGGIVSNDLVDSTDFLPTLLEAAGAPRPNDVLLDGLSFFPQLQGEAGCPRDWVFCHYDPRPGWDKDQFTLSRFARDQRFKLYDDGRLFDVPADPLEQSPLPSGIRSIDAIVARAKLRAVLDDMARVPNDRADAYRHALGDGD